MWGCRASVGVGIVVVGLGQRPARSCRRLAPRASIFVPGRSIIQERLPYALVRLTPATVDVLARNAPRLSSSFSDRRAPGQIRFGIGDVVGVTIFEAAAGGLFIPPRRGPPGQLHHLAKSAGRYQWKYLRAVCGRDTRERSYSRRGAASYRRCAQNRAIEPQVVVSLADQRTSLISVLGDVNTPARFPAN